MEADAFVLLQLHETNKHTIKHKESSNRLWPRPNVELVQSAKTVRSELLILYSPKSVLAAEQFLSVR